MEYVSTIITDVTLDSGNAGNGPYTKPGVIYTGTVYKVDNGMIESSVTIVNVNPAPEDGANFIIARFKSGELGEYVTIRTLVDEVVEIAFGEQFFCSDTWVQVVTSLSIAD
jgi:hypothetical protein